MNLFMITNTGLSKIVPIILMAGMAFLFACSNDSKVNGKGKGASENTDSTSNESGSSSSINFNDVSNDVCDCLSNLENDLSSKAKEIFISAAENDNPRAELNEKFSNITDSVERRRMEKELEGFSDASLLNCLGNVQKKYPAIKNPDKKSQKEFLSAVEDNCSEFAAAFMKIGAKARATGN